MANGEPQNVTQAATRVANSLIATLPPAFVVLVGLNVLFLAAVLWFFNAQSEQRLMLAGKIIDGCSAVQAKLIEHELRQ